MTHQRTRPGRVHRPLGVLLVLVVVALVVACGSDEPQSGPSASGDVVRGADWDFGDMEPIEGLSADDVEAVIAFVRAEQERLGFEG